MNEYLIIYLIVVLSTIIVTILFRLIYDYKKVKIKKQYLNRNSLLEYEKIINEFREKYQIDLNDNIETIVHKLNLKVEYVKLPRGIEGKIEDKKILISENAFFREKQFCIAHEIGHIIRGDLSGTKKRHSVFLRNENEDKLDYIAAALILPKLIMEQELEKNKFDLKNSKQKMAFIRELSDKYNIQKELIIRRIHEIKLMSESE